MAARTTRFSVGTKILLVAASFGLPIVVLTYFVIATINGSIDFAAHELLGDRYQRALEAVLEPLTQQQILLHACPSDCEAQFNALKAATDTAFGKLIAVDDELAVALQFTDAGLGKRKRSHAKASTVKAEWKVLAMNTTGVPGHGDPPLQLKEQYEHLIGDLRTMIAHVGDTSNLILDPDLDSYYLMDVTLLGLPQTQDRIAKLSWLGATALAHDPVDPADRVKLAVGAALLQEADLDRIASSTETSINEDPGFYGTSPSLSATVRPGLASYQKAAGALIAQLVPAAGATVTAPTLATAAMAASTASFRLWDRAVGELDALLDARIADLRGSRSMALGVSGIALAIACLLAWMVSRSITRPLRTAVGSLGPGADLLAAAVSRIAEVARRPSASPEETSIICEELDAHAADMRTVVRDLVAQVRGGTAGEP